MITITLSNGLRVLNATKHPYVMEDGQVVPPNPEVADILKATFVEEEVPGTVAGVRFVLSVAKPMPMGQAWLEGFKRNNLGVFVVTSGVSLQAYLDPVVIGFIATEETQRVADHGQKKMRLDKVQVAAKSS